MPLVGQQFVAYLIALCVALYVLYLLVADGRIGAHTPNHYYYFSWLECANDATKDFDDPDYVPEEEGFELPPPPPPSTNNDSTGAVQQSAPTAMSAQNLIDFSDITITEAQRKEWQDTQQNAKQMQSVNERFDAAKRKTDEYRLKPGVMPQKKRRQLVEYIIRRPYCGRRTRSWRTAFSDTLRGDVVPKGQSSWNVMRIGRSDPAVDLHPGALGPMSGK